MTYKQVKPFNQDIAGSLAGSCLANTRKGYGIASKYPNAWAAWLNTQQHTGKPPEGLDVPVFFWYINGSNGHIGVRLANGKFWSDGDIYASIAAYEAVKKPDYVGWGESINGVSVLERVAEAGQRLYFDPIGQTATFYPVKGGTFAMKIKDASYNWSVLENQGNRVRVNSASAGGDCWVYLKYTNTGSTIPGRYVMKIGNK
jgi:hypothetical protein